MRKLGPILMLLLVASVTVAEPPYFPVRQNPGDVGVSAFEAAWYGKALSRMNEPRLPELSKNSKAVVYRLTILPTRGKAVEPTPKERFDNALAEAKANLETPSGRDDDRSLAKHFSEHTGASKLRPNQILQLSRWSSRCRKRDPCKKSWSGPRPTSQFVSVNA